MHVTKAHTLFIMLKITLSVLKSLKNNQKGKTFNLYQFHKQELFLFFFL